MTHRVIDMTISTSLGAASDKVAALEKAGAIVTDSPAKIGQEMLKVRRSHFDGKFADISLSPGNQGCRSRLVVDHIPNTSLNYR